MHILLKKTALAVYLVQLTLVISKNFHVPGSEERTGTHKTELQKKFSCQKNVIISRFQTRERRQTHRGRRLILTINRLTVLLSSSNLTKSLTQLLLHLMYLKTLSTLNFTGEVFM